ncbi:hypothetical protein HC031_20215 [Planosporangium thailandense]|uniref:WXG100 family type VII secretion target n=1 Tax=Planosporangium thailandense TaxID=765197 RepID=A0ABX0Y3L2_9ACTN|nr:hypothetical protein [Planosporangium thailandense]NJC72023.1 hypothetical protein [Planosporangium thailandense]
MPKDPYTMPGAVWHVDPNPQGDVTHHDYDHYSYEQIEKAITGGFVNDPTFNGYVDPGRIHQIGDLIASAGRTLGEAAETLDGERRTLTDEWKGAGADEFFKIIDEVRDWLRHTSQVIAMNYAGATHEAGNQLAQAQAILHNIAAAAVRAQNEEDAAKAEAAARQLGLAGGHVAGRPYLH